MRSHAVPRSLVASFAWLAALGAASCASTGTLGDVASFESPKTAARPDEIVRLRTRGGDVALLAGASGAVTIYDASGAALRTSAIADLRVTDPELFQILTSATARGPYLDARLDPPEVRASAPSGPAFDPR